MSTKMPDCELNLTNIGKYLKIDNEITGIKYKYAEMDVIKGEYLTTRYKKAKIKDKLKVKRTLFYNQITIIVNNGGNYVNIKLFKNGTLHLTGCKDINEGETITRILYEKLRGMEEMYDNILLTRDSNNILIDKDNLVYSYTNNEIIGYYKDNVYNINKNEYVINKITGMFIAKKEETQRKKRILNLDGEENGYAQIILVKNKKLYRNNKNIQEDEKFIYYNNTIIGEIEYNIKNVDKYCFDKDVFEIRYKCNPFKNKTYRLDTKSKIFKRLIDVNINCINIYFTLEYEINRKRLYERLLEMNYMCKYKPESYSGIKCIYKINSFGNYYNQKMLGKCECVVKCTCLNITFLIFQSGKVIGTGFREYDSIQYICNDFISKCNDISDQIKKRNQLK